MLKGKHAVVEIEGIRCTIVENSASDERIKFLKEVLEFNGYETRTEKEKAKE